MCRSKIDPCGICAKRVMANSVRCIGYNVESRFTKMKRVIYSCLAKQFFCKKCKATIEGSEVLVEELCQEVKMVDGFVILETD